MEELHTPKSPLLPPPPPLAGPTASSESGRQSLLALLVAADVRASAQIHRAAPGICIDAPLMLFALAFSYYGVPLWVALWIGLSPAGKRWSYPAAVVACLAVVMTLKVSELVCLSSSDASLITPLELIFLPYE